MRLLFRTLVCKLDKSKPILVEGKEGQSPTIFPHSNSGKRTLETQFKPFINVKTPFVATAVLTPMPNTLSNNSVQDSLNVFN